MDPQDGARTQNDRALRRPPSPRRRHQLRSFVLRLRHARRRRIPHFHQREFVDRGPQALRLKILRRIQRRRLHRPAEFFCARPLRRIFPHSAQRAHPLRRQIHLCALRHHSQRNALRARMGRLRDAGDQQHHASTSQNLRQRRSVPGDLLRIRRTVRSLLQRQKRQIPIPAGNRPAKNLADKEERARGWRLAPHIGLSICRQLPAKPSPTFPQTRRNPAPSSPAELFPAPSSDPAKYAPRPDNRSQSPPPPHTLPESRKSPAPSQAKFPPSGAPLNPAPLPVLSTSRKPPPRRETHDDSTRRCDRISVSPRSTPPPEHCSPSSG